MLPVSMHSCTYGLMGACIGGTPSCKCVKEPSYVREMATGSVCYSGPERPAWHYTDACHRVIHHNTRHTISARHAAATKCTNTACPTKVQLNSTAQQPIVHLSKPLSGTPRSETSMKGCINHSPASCTECHSHAPDQRPRVSCRYGKQAGVCSAACQAVCTT